MRKIFDLTYCTCSNRRIDQILKSTHQQLYNYYLVNNEVMDDKDKITTLENIIDLAKLIEEIENQLEKLHNQ